MWTAIKTAAGFVGDMLGLSAAKLYLYAGLAVSGVIAVLTVLWKVRQAGVDAERARQDRERLKSIAVKRNLDRQIDALPVDKMEERAMRWARD